MDTATVTSLIGSWTLWSVSLCFCFGFSYTLCKDGTNTLWIQSAKMIFESIMWLCWDIWCVCDISMAFVWCSHEMSRSISHAHTPSLVHPSIVFCLSKGQSQWQVVTATVLLPSHTFHFLLLRCMREVPRRHPNQMPEPPHVALFDIEFRIFPFIQNTPRFGAQ